MSDAEDSTTEDAIACIDDAYNNDWVYVYADSVEVSGQQYPIKECSSVFSIAGGGVDETTTKRSTLTRTALGTVIAPGIGTMFGWMAKKKKYHRHEQPIVAYLTLICQGDAYYFETLDIGSAQAIHAHISSAISH